MVLGRLLRDGGAARKERTFIRCQGGFNVARMVAQRVAEFGTVEDREVCPFTRERRHQVSRIADQGDTWNAVPSMVDRQGMNEPDDGCCIAIGDQCPQLWSPTFELGGKSLERGRRLIEIDGIHPRFGPVQRDIGLQGGVGKAVGKDAFAWLDRQQARESARCQCPVDALQPSTAVVP